ncbi:MAG: orotate phosphoribosyltransferase [Burkholderiales bacterium]
MQEKSKNIIDQLGSEKNTVAMEFVKFAIESKVLQFGEFKTKAGRLSPYFFNAGGFDDGIKLGKLAGFYAASLMQSGIKFDMLFGPAYKGIPLCTALAIELGKMGRHVSFAFNRKEAKAHGEGGTVVGAPLRGRVLIVDDVISAGTSVRESMGIIESAGATPCGVVVALDRQEKMAENNLDLPYSAVQYVNQHYGLEVCAVACLEDLMRYFKSAKQTQDVPAADWVQLHAKVAAYRQSYGVVCAS